MRRRVLSLGTCGKRGALRRVALERGVNPPYTHRAPRTGVCAYCCPMPTGRGDIHAPRQPGACLRAPLWRCSGKGDTAGKDRAPPVPGGSPWGGGWISPASPIPEFHHNSCPFFHPPKKNILRNKLWRAELSPLCQRGAGDGGRAMSKSPLQITASWVTLGGGDAPSSVLGSGSLTLRIQQQPIPRRGDQALGHLRLCPDQEGAQGRGDVEG